MIDCLKGLGLTEYESKAYVALLRQGEIDGKEVSRSSGVPYSAVHFVLRQLVQKNFAVAVSRKPMRFRAIKAANALDSFVKEKTQELSNLKEEAVRELSHLERMPAQGFEKVEISAGAGQRFANAIQLTDGTRKEKLDITNANTIPLLLLKASAAAVKRGVKFKLIATEFNEDNKQVVRQYKKIGAEVRYYPPLKGFTLVIYDKVVSLLVIRDLKRKESGYSLKLNSPQLAEAFAEYFNYIWKKAKPI